MARSSGSDVSVVVTHEIYLIMGKSNFRFNESLVSLIYYLFQRRVLAKSHVYVNSMLYIRALPLHF